MIEFIKRFFDEKIFAMFVIALIAAGSYAIGEQGVALVAIGAVAGLAGGNAMK